MTDRDEHIDTLRARLLSATATQCHDAGATPSSVPYCMGYDGRPLIGWSATSATSLWWMLNDSTRLCLAGSPAELAASDPGCARFRRFFPAHSSVIAAWTVRRASIVDEAGRETPLDYAAFALASPFTSDIEARMVDHMNEDHVAALVDYCRADGIDVAESPRMLSVDAYGFFVTTPAGLHRFTFASPCSTGGEVRQALVEMAQQARRKLAASVA